MKNWAFYGPFHARGMTLKVLADALGVKSHTHLCEVICGKRFHAHKTRKRIAPHLTAGELFSLGWDGQGRLVENRKLEISNLKGDDLPLPNVPRGTSSLLPPLVSPSGEEPIGTGGW